MKASVCAAVMSDTHLDLHFFIPKFSLWLQGFYLRIMQIYYGSCLFGEREREVEDQALIKLQVLFRGLRTSSSE